MVKCSRYRPCVAQRVGIVTALHFHDRGTGRGWMVSSTPCPNFTPKIDPVPILQEVGWAPGLVWSGGKSRPHQDSIPTLKSVVSRYTDWATRPTNLYILIYGLAKHNLLNICLLTYCVLRDCILNVIWLKSKWDVLTKFWSTAHIILFYPVQ